MWCLIIGHVLLELFDLHLGLLNLRIALRPLLFELSLELRVLVFQFKSRNFRSGSKMVVARDD